MQKNNRHYAKIVLLLTRQELFYGVSHSCTNPTRAKNFTFGAFICIVFKNFCLSLHRESRCSPQKLLKQYKQIDTMLRKFRIVAAAMCFVLITLLFLDFTGTLHAWFGWLAKIQFLPAIMAMNVGVVLFLVVATLLFGRLYCSVI